MKYSSLAQINKVQTTVDGGIRVTLDLPATESQLAGELIQLKSSGKDALYVSFISPDEVSSQNE